MWKFDVDDWIGYMSDVFDVEYWGFGGFCGGGF